MPYSHSPLAPRVADMSFNGVRLLLVEDEALVAMMLEDMLAELGCTVAAVTSTIAQALDFIGKLAPSLDGALLDVNIGGEKIYPVADVLTRLGVPFLFVTGYGRGALDELYPNAIVVTKPYTAASLSAGLKSLPGRDRAGTQG